MRTDNFRQPPLVGSWVQSEDTHLDGTLPRGRTPLFYDVFN